MTKTKTIPFDPAEYLSDDEALATYLTEALAADDVAHFQEALQTVARARGMSQIAEAAGLGRESLYKALKPGTQPRFDTVQRVLAAVGVRLSVEPVKAA